ncbi:MULTISPECIES: ABC transporter substrate-binding protein [Glaesserella]|uniref:Peptide ABC transporter substrate-binding protein n=1 Tax=Glaesserella australis TaxID=2094024 RepID=A0A328BZ62_9PAST|nr:MULTISPECIES: ABC transporter substrate-binding protein [Glaesserella]AUI67172.1 peptide ABC transporter substrate-binding protein [Glaesserella sp. 15-184]RAL18372.1 peptide ABC transporter substrate-binding protein [Glaesserella australis]
MLKHFNIFNRTLAITLLTSFLIAPISQARVVQDIEGKGIELPEKVERIVDLWPANNQMVLLLGGADKLVGTAKPIVNNPWFVEVYPKIKDVPVLANGNDVNIESLLAQNPDVALMSNKNQLKLVEQAGVKGVLVMFQDFDGLKKTLQITANVIGGNAPNIAQEYIKELDGNIQFVADRLKDLKEEERPTVIHIANGSNTTKIDGGMSIVGEWVKLAGGKNAFNDKANLVDVTMEDILRVNPDVIIVGSANAVQGVEKILSDPIWKELQAVQKGRVYVNPQGTFPWDRYSAEEALQVLWAAKLLHPTKFEDVDMVAKTQAFYKKYYNYDLSKENAEQILKGGSPIK